MFRDEGMASLYKGLCPALLRQVGALPCFACRALKPLYHYFKFGKKSNLVGTYISRPWPQIRFFALILFTYQSSNF